MPVYTLFILRKKLVCNQFLLGSDLGITCLLPQPNKLSVYLLCIKATSF